MNIFDLFSQNIIAKVKLDAPHGVHLRPSAMIANIAKDHNGKVLIELGSIKIDAKDMNKILALGLKDGDEIEVMAGGKNAKAAVDKVVNFLSTLSDEKIQESKTFTNNILNFNGKKIQGSVICGGLGIGVPYFWQRNNENNVVKKQTFDNAYMQTLDNLSSIDDNDIFMAQKVLLKSLPKTSFEEFESAVEEAIESLKGSEHEAKTADYKDLLNSIKAIMSGAKNVEFPKDDFMIIADELLPSDIVKLSNSPIKGAVVKNLPSRSHAALLLRSHKIPAISIDENIEILNDVVILDALSGCLVTEPSERDLLKAKEEISKNIDKDLLEFEHRFNNAKTKSGKSIKVLANIGDKESAKEALHFGCDGIGLLRSEFLFQEKKPSLDEQFEAYSEIFSMFDEVTIRTLDIGGDKSLPYVSLEAEQNPFLGVRGIRLFKTHKELMSEQLLSILSAKRKKELKIMFPMVATVDEFVEAKELALNIAKENELSLENVSFGIMIEVPSVLFLLEEFNKVVDFYSIGTNDLSQYLFAIDRTHKMLKIDPHSNALFDVLSLIASKSSKPVSICGELASDEGAIERLLNIGFEALSVPSKMVPTIKSRIRNV